MNLYDISLNVRFKRYVNYELISTFYFNYLYFELVKVAPVYNCGIEHWKCVTHFLPLNRKGNSIYKA